MIERALSYYSVEELWGVGRKQTQFLNDKGIFQASHYLKTDEARKTYEYFRSSYIKRLNGIPCFKLRNETLQKEHHDVHLNMS